MHTFSGVDQNNESVAIRERIPLGRPENVGKWSRNTVHFPQSYGFRPPVLVEADNSFSCATQNTKTSRESFRTNKFSEESCKWHLPIDDSNIVSDGIKIDDGLLVATVNPFRLYHCKNFMDEDTAQEINIDSLIPRYRSIRKSRMRLANLGGNFVLLHEEESNITAIIDLETKEMSILPSHKSMSSTVGAMLTGTNYPWRLSNQLSNHGLLYECGGSEILVYSHGNDGVTVTSGTIPYTIKRIFASGPQMWNIVTKDNENLLLKLEDGKWMMESISHDGKTGLDTVGAQFHGNKTTLISEPYYFVKGDCAGKPSQFSGVPRPPLEGKETFHRRPFSFTDEKVATNDLSREVTFLGNTVIRGVPGFLTPRKFIDDRIKSYDCIGFLEAVDTDKNRICYVPVPHEGNFSLYMDWVAGITKSGFHVVPWNDDQVLTITTSGHIRSFELSLSTLSRSFDEWNRATSGPDGKKMRMEFDRKPEDVDMDKLDEPKLGKFDPNNAPHHGGNQWMGGTGGYNTAGLGGVGGPFRLDAGHDVHQMPDFAKKKVPDHILKKAREIAKVEYAKKLREINMSDHDAESYESLWKRVQAPSKKLASVIDQLEAKKKEREWVKHQTSGDLDDGKLIEGVTGEQNIYRRRADKIPDPGAPQTKPKRLKLCMDVSGSMYRFNGYDQRLAKTMEATLMTMAALDGKTDKVKYEIVGHSGDSPCVSFVKMDQHPKNDKERLDTLKRMMAHTQARQEYCVSGDNTVESLQYAVKEMAVKKDDYDENVVILVSDANLQRYGIKPKTLKDAMLKDPTINSFVIIIGCLSEEGDILQETLPAGKCFVLKDTSELPKIMETIFASTIAQ